MHLRHTFLILKCADVEQPDIFLTETEFFSTNRYKNNKKEFVRVGITDSGPMKKNHMNLKITVLAAMFLMITIGGCEEKPLANQSKSDIEKLIQQLSADERNPRESVQIELAAIGKKLIGEYRKIKWKIKMGEVDKTNELNNCKEKISELAKNLSEANQNKDPEIKSRAKQIQQSLFRLTQCEIAFSSKRHTKGDEASVHPNHKEESEIYVMDAEGKNIVRLTGNNTSDGRPAWNPDGSKIFFVAGKDICIMDADGQNQIKLAEGTTPQWNRDGTKITFVSEGGVNIVDLDGKNHNKLLKKGFSLALSPYGTKIAYATSEGTNEEKNLKYFIHIMDANGKNQIKLSEGENFHWSSDSTITFIVEVRDTKDYYKVLTSDIYLIDINTKERKKITKEEMYIYQPNLLNADKTKIAFESGGKIYVMDTDGENRRELTKTRGHSPVWSPDGSKILFQNTAEL
ncbi:MAG: hypothetical protein V1701_09595 [Planctomycetota bacterium]